MLFENFVVDSFAAAAVHAGGEAFEDDFIGDVEVDDGVDFFAHAFESFSEGIRLRDGAGKTVKDETFFAIGLPEAFADHAADEGIGNQTAGFHDGTGFFTGGKNEGATYEVIQAMMDAAEGRCKIKGAGGIRDREKFLRLIDMGIDRMGIGYKSTAKVLGLDT